MGGWAPLLPGLAWLPLPPGPTDLCSRSRRFLSDASPGASVNRSLLVSVAIRELLAVPGLVLKIQQFHLLLDHFWLTCHHLLSFSPYLIYVKPRERCCLSSCWKCLDVSPWCPTPFLSKAPEQVTFIFFLPPFFRGCGNPFLSLLAYLILFVKTLCSLVRFHLTFPGGDRGVKAFLPFLCQQIHLYVGKTTDLPAARVRTYLSFESIIPASDSAWLCGCLK